MTKLLLTQRCLWQRAWVVAIAAICLIVQSCGSAETSAPPPNPASATPATSSPLPKLTPSSTTSVAPSVPASPGPPTLEDVLARAAKVDTISYEMTVTEPGKPASTSKVKAKGNRAMVETTSGNISMTLIFDGVARKSYVYVEMVRMAVQSDAGDNQQMYSPAGFAKYIRPLGAKMTGTASVNGQPAIIVEYKDKEGRPMKVWLAVENGVILRSEDASSKQTIEVSKVNYSPISDLLFQLPPDTKLVSDAELTDVLSTRTHTDKDRGYSIQVPPGWLIDDTDKADVRLKPADLSVIIFAIMSAPAGVLTFDQHVWVVSEAQKSTSPDYRMISSGKVGSGNSACYTEVGTYTQKDFSEPMRDLRLLTLVNGNCVKIVVLAPESEWKAHERTLNGMVESFKRVPKLDTYTNSTYAYTITLAEGWKASAKSKDEVVVTSLDQTAMVSVSAFAGQSASLDVLFEAAVTGVYGKLPGFHELDRSKISLGGMPAWGILFATSNPSTRRMVVMTVKDKVLFVVMYAMTENLFEKYVPEVQKMVGSLKFGS